MKSLLLSVSVFGFLLLLVNTVHSDVRLVPCKDLPASDLDLCVAHKRTRVLCNPDDACPVASDVCCTHEHDHEEPHSSGKPFCVQHCGEEGHSHDHDHNH